MKKLLALLLCVLCLVTMIAGCGTKEPEADPAANEPAANEPAANEPAANEPAKEPVAEPAADAKYKEEITVINDTNIVSLNRFNPGMDSTATQRIYLIIYDRLLDETVDGELVPMLAESWSTDDYKTFTFKLRDDVVFHNGEPFTADDVVYTFEKAAEATGTNTFDNLGRNTESVEAVSDYEVKVTLKNVDVYFPNTLALPGGSIINRDACEADFEAGVLIGTGPWTVEKVASNEYASLLRNDNYWGEIPVTKKLVMRYVAEEPARIMMLENGEAQAALGTNFTTDYPYLESDPKFTVFDVPSYNPAYVCFNMNDPITGDLNFRKAVASCIDRDSYVSISRNGYAFPFTDGTFWAYNTEYRNTDIPMIPYDLDAAAKYLEESSYNGEEVVITCAIPNCISDAQLLQEQLRSIGVNASINQTDPAGVNAQATYENNQTQILIFLVQWPAKASSVRSVYYPGAAVNRASYNNPEVTELLDKVATEADAATREQLYKEIQALAAEDIPYVGTYYNITLLGALKGVGGVEMRPNMFHRMAYIYMVEE